MDLLSVIRRWHGRDGLSMREIARRTGLSRHTIRKYLNSGVVQPKYPPRQGVSQLDPFAETLAAWLQREARRGRKRRRNLKQLHRDLAALGYSGSYDRVAAFARAWRQREAAHRASRGTYVPLVFAPGEAFQFDWSEDWVHVGGRKMKLQVAHFKLCHSRAFMLRCYPLQTHEMLFDAHNHCLAALGGVPRRGIYDNMKTAVDKIGRGKQRQVNARFRAMASHFLLETDFCNAAAGWEVVFERNRYSVPASLANQVIGLRVYADRLVMVAHNASVAEHQRVFTRDHSGPAQTVYDWCHYLAVVQRKPGALRNGAPFTTLPASLRSLQGVLLKQPGGDREMAHILALVLHHEEALVEQAVRQALEDGVPTKTHVLNRLGRLLDTAPVALEPPPALTVNDEPRANTERYDALREARHGD